MASLLLKNLLSVIASELCGQQSQIFNKLVEKHPNQFTENILAAVTAAKIFSVNQIFIYCIVIELNNLVNWLLIKLVFG